MKTKDEVISKLEFAREQVEAAIKDESPTSLLWWESVVNGLEFVLDGRPPTTVETQSSQVDPMCAWCNHRHAPYFRCDTLYA